VAGPVTPSDVLLDLEVVSRLREDFALAQLESLLGTFSATLHERLAHLQAALTRCDHRGADAILHSLKGSSATYGARELSQAMEALRHRLDVDPDSSAGAVVQLRALAERSIAQLRARLLQPTARSPVGH
jgi:HPt (histidine-containing phosphotransfer) domain-containing protein